MTERLIDQINIFDKCDLIQFSRITYRDYRSRILPKKHFTHTHPQFEMFILIKGEGDFFVQESWHHIRPGDIVLIRGQERHCLTGISAEEYDHCFFQFSENSFPPVTDRIRVPTDCFLDRAMGTMNHVTPSPEAWDKILWIVERLSELVRVSSSTPNGPFQKIGLTLALFDIVAEEWRRAYPDDEAGRPLHTDHPVVALALDYMDHHYLSVKSIEEVSAACGVSHAYLSRIFKQKLGVTPVEYLRQKRISFVKQRLLDGCTVTEVCYEAGFQNYSYFIQVFKKETGMTPLVFQKNKRIV